MDEDYVYNALLRYNYFPMISKYHDELPPVIYSEEITPVVADQMINENGQSRKGGYDQVEMRMTRHNKVTRIEHIPHPLPYAQLCKAIAVHWSNIRHICDSRESRIKPTRYEDSRIIVYEGYELEDVETVDDRIMVMGSGPASDDRMLELDLSTNNRYLATADISAFFPSIYTHSIPWALVGHEHAKSHRSPSLWFNEIDKHQRDLKRGETHGVPIGPATSNVLSEVILFKVDEALCAGGFNFVRYIDDYRCYCKSRDEAERFLVSIENELREYLLELNVNKVSVEELPIPHDPNWKIALASMLPVEDEPNFRKVSQYLDYAINMQRTLPDESIAKYAARSLSGKVVEETSKLYVRALFALAFENPSVLPVLCKFCWSHSEYRHLVPADNFDEFMARQMSYRRSDAMCWALFLMGMCGHEIPDSMAQGIIKTRDCMAMAMLIALKQHCDKVVEFVNGIPIDDEYGLDSYWVLVYELRKLIDTKYDCYLAASGLDVLGDAGVSFVRSIDELCQDSHSAAGRLPF
ncbi:MAG: RNA-directed DNA polymerase [Chloroflexi bacterium]|nr:RNA-directed DNA polymerase [Chloroflexota bacterium]